MTLAIDTFRALRGAAERLACDVVTEVEPRPGSQASAVFVFAAAIGLARACACIGRESPTGPSGNQLRGRMGLDSTASPP